MRDGWTKSIPAQWREDVAKTPPPTTVIMNGGGNDVNSVRGDCEVFNGNCLRQINDAAAIGAKLLQQMHDDGGWVGGCEADRGSEVNQSSTYRSID